MHPGPLIPTKSEKRDPRKIPAKLTPGPRPLKLAWAWKKRRSHPTEGGEASREVWPKGPIDFARRFAALCCFSFVFPANFGNSVFIKFSAQKWLGPLARAVGDP